MRSINILIARHLNDCRQSCDIGANLCDITLNSEMVHNFYVKNVDAFVIMLWPPKQKKKKKNIKKIIKNE